MCGILGGVFRHSIPATGAPQGFEKAACSLEHRGPDDRGLAVIPEANAILAFRRLSIIDLATGAQPMSTDTGQHIVFNGEIYNYREVRRELEARGQRFHTTSDTEVLLKGLALDGINSLTRLCGMWGLGFLDVPGRRLWLARDRLGVKQLYYSCTDQGIFFASEPKALLGLPWVRGEFNRDELANYLTFRCVPSPNTLFLGINKLAPGTVLEHDLEAWKSRVHRYWTAPEGGLEASVRFKDAVPLVEQALLEAVRRRLVSDVPVGALLSGGLDSSLVVAAMRRLGHPEIRTFAAVFPGSRDNEEPFSRRVAARFHTAHHEQPTRAGDFLESLPDWIELNDDLVADASSLPLLLVSRLARANGCKVLLSGEGADELFSGYGSYHKYLLLRQGAGLVPSPGLRRQIVTVLTALRLLKPQDLSRVREYFVRERGYLGTAALWGAEEIEELAPAHDRYEPPRAAGRRLDDLGAFDFARRIPDDLLVRTDRATMGSSVEARVPFLDHELVELVHRIPRITRALPGLSKVALRIVAMRWGVPLQTVAHRKIGFQIPLARWFRTDLRAVLDRVLEERVVPGLNYEAASRIVGAHLRGGGEFEEMLWRVTALELWYRRWILGVPAGELLQTSAGHGTGLAASRGRVVAGC
ncbi:MAG TPA: asparagine synthase (glutamine-hydrolyzing) [Anaeromyxobacteraceae bacterium]|nr:asparagine synthase (glutamine-hydrolyzing) [Anaeromyxobacteraceae bacterium]